MRSDDPLPLIRRRAAIGPNSGPENAKLQEEFVLASTGLTSQVYAANHQAKCGSGADSRWCGAEQWCAAAMLSGDPVDIV